MPRRRDRTAAALSRPPITDMLPALGPVWSPIGMPCREATLAVGACPHPGGPGVALGGLALDVVARYPILSRAFRAAG